MGERAVITATSAVCANLVDEAIYTHWNVGRDFVEAYLTYCRMQGYTPPEKDKDSLSRLREIMRNHIYGIPESGEDNPDQVSIDILAKFQFSAYGDEGVYVIKNWKIVKRMMQEEHNKMAGELLRYDLIDLLLEIDEAQPENVQLGEKQIKSKLRKLYWRGYWPRRTWLQKLVKELKVRRYERWCEKETREYVAKHRDRYPDDFNNIYQ